MVRDIVLLLQQADGRGDSEHERLRFTRDALVCLQECSEQYMCTLFGTGKEFSFHAKRVTLKLADVKLFSQVVAQDFGRPIFVS